MHSCIFFITGEYALRDFSDTEDSFSSGSELGDSRAATSSSKRSPAVKPPEANNEVNKTTDTARETNTSSETSVTAAECTSSNMEEELRQESSSAGAKQPTGGEGAEKAGKEEEEEDKGDPEMAPVYIKRLLPVMAEVFHSSLAPALRKECLRLMKKICRYITSEWLEEISQERDVQLPTFPAQISEVLAITLENEVKRRETDGVGYVVWVCDCEHWNIASSMCNY